MAVPSIFTRKELAFLRELTRRDVEFLVVGLAAAALHGAPAVTQDVDLWFRDLSDPALRRALKKVGGAYVGATASTPPLFAGEAVELFDVVVHMHGLDDFDKEYKRGEEIDLGGFVVRVLPLDRIIKSKKATGRPKDRAILPALQDTLRTLRVRRRRR